MKLYQVTAHYTRLAANGWKESAGIPTFYLRDDMQGIVNADHAERIARQMLSVLAPDATFSIAVAESQEFEPATIGA